jgi:hypothetical protein
LGRLPRTVRWKRVIELLEHSANVSDITQASLRAAEKGLSSAPADEGFARTLATIFDFVDAAQSKDTFSALRDKGFSLAEEPTLLDFTISFSERVDASTADLRSKSDLAEIAKNSFNQVVFTRIAPLLPTLFGTTSAEIENALKGQLRGKQLQGSMHEFFVIFTNRYLQYYLRREIANHIGIGRALASANDHAEFNRAFETYIRQTVRITDEFTPGWFGKARYEKRLSRAEVSKFAHVAFKKIRSEFQRGAESSG